MSDDHADGVQKPLPLFDPMLMGGASISNPFMYSLCGCNGSTGPCFRHMEELRLQLLQTHQVLHRGAPSAGNDSSTTPPLPQHDGLDRMELTSSHGSLPRHHQGLDSLQASQASRMPSARWVPRGVVAASPNDSHSLESPSCHSQQPSSVPSTSTLPSNSGARSSNDVDDIASRDTPHSSARSASPNETAANNTWRFTRILETVQELGFADFDSMVEAYYTGDFVKSSWPGDAQRGSRTRGFPKLASRIQESSERWPRWQHRMISQGIMSCAKTICAGELEALVRNIEVQQAHNDGIRLPLSSEMYSSRRSSPRPSPGAGDCREILTSSLSTLGTLPESIESAIHDEALHTLSLLTELATPSSPYCDRVASIAIAFLVDSRKGL
ncbi:hypothetical protein DOTSEDRAFT_55891 [Dothistroma septosporum NZE10]|uniref:Uncharacterized protein n=1 Tax=Dothistroma septosporum (strain NZE10 / CBS 128990) TaxID=675120 RepID=N1PDV1_DOTSN|nr:hypothetical protein DOTSEDRAFT_55891 [Dothistroma septosporum NZE10]